MKNRILREFIFYGTIAAGAWTWYKYHINDVVYHNFTRKDATLIERLETLKPAYIYGRGAKHVLINHQIDNGRDEVKMVYNKHINEVLSQRNTNNSNSTTITSQGPNNTSSNINNN